MNLQDLTRERVVEIAPASTIILPTAAIEQHGPHLPMSTDTRIVEAIAAAAANRAATEVPVLVAPTVCFGSSHHHLFAAAMSLRSDTFLRVINDLADSLVQAGFRRIFVLNGHGGNDECVRLLAKDLVLRAQVSVAACSYWEVAAEAIRGVGVPALFPGHAGWFETSLMLSIAPELVDREAFPAATPTPPAISSRGIARGLAVQKYGEWRRTGGFSDAPAGAAEETGRRLLASIAETVGEAVVAFHRSA